jgi:hypothetical protein
MEGDALSYRLKQGIDRGWVPDGHVDNPLGIAKTCVFTDSRFEIRIMA